MDNTEAYRIVLTKLPEEIANADAVGHLWNTISEEISMQTGIYVSALIYEMVYACGKAKDCNGPTEKAIMISSIRNPAFYTDPAGYRKSLFLIVDDLRKVLNEPFLSLDVYEVSYLYFEPRTI